MSGAVFLKGENVELRTIEEEDLEFVRDNFNHPEVRRGLGYRRPHNLEDEREWFEEVVTGTDDIHMAICEDGDIRGVISLEERKEESTTELGIWIGKEFQGEGLGTEASKMIVEHGFNQLNYHKIIARAYSSNTASRNIWDKLGFEQEGRMREQKYQNGGYEDVVIYGLLETEWD